MSNELLESTNSVITVKVNGYSDENKNERVECNEALEGGWGYVAVFAVSIFQILVLGPVSSLGILFHDFLLAHGTGKQAIVVFITSMNIGVAVSGIGSYTASLALKKFSVQQIAFCGALFVLIGDLSAVFMTESVHFIIIYGFIRGFGFGVLFSLGFMVINGYFKVKRISMITLAQTSVCLGGIVYPIIITKMMTFYGFRGCLLLMFAMNLHLIVGVLLLIPARTKTSKKVKINNANDAKTLEEKNVLLKVRQEKANIASERENATLWKRFVNFFNLDILADPVFVNIAVGMSLANFADANFKIIEPLLLYSYNLKQDNIAVCISVGGIADFISRVLMALFTFYIKAKPRVLFFIVLCLSLITRLVFLASEDYMYVTVMTAVIGLVRSWIAVLYPLVIADHVSQDNFAASYGLFVIITGITMSIGGPITGFIQNATGGYIFVVYALSICNAVNIFTWTIEFIYIHVWNKIKII